MASNSIKGLTAKIGADTSDFIKALKAVDREINQTQKTANALQKGLKLDYNEKNFLQSQKQVQKALETTEEKAKAIRQQMEKLEQSGQVDTDGYRRLETELAKSETKASELKNQLTEIDKIKLEKVGSGVKTLSTNLEKAAKETAVFSAAAVGAIVGINKLTKDAVASGDTIQTTADQYNLSAEAIQRWNYIALQSDVPADKLYKAMTKSRDAIGTALADGSSTGRAALEALIGDLAKVPTDTEGAFTTVINALAGVEDATLQAYYANEIFGERVATELIPLLNQGADGLARLSQEFEAVGYLTNEQVRALADYDNELNKVNTRLANVKTEIGLALLPLLEAFTTILETAVVPVVKLLAGLFEILPDEVQGVIAVMLLLVAALSPVLYLMSSALKVLPLLQAGLKKLGLTAKQAAGGFTAMASALYLTFDLIGNWKQMTLVEKILKALAVAALTAAAAVTVFHASWSMGAVIGVITASIVAGIAAIKAAAEDIGVEAEFGDNTDFVGGAGTNYELPVNDGNYGNYTTNTSSYVDNSNVVINIEKNEYMTEDDIIRAVNKGLKQAKQART